MSAAVLQIVWRPNPGADMAEVMPFVKDSARLWKEAGADDVRFYGVQVGEAGNFAFVVRCASAATLGAAVDKLQNNPAFTQWRAKALKSGLGQFVRSNQLFEIPLG